ncbi:MAG: hypothetical protein SNJ76_12270, partial [Fimbriimonadaceae bacterium]
WNYFGQPWGSPELETIRGLLKGVLENEEMADQILAWRKSHPKPYLTLCLQGQHMRDLKEAVFLEVEKELARHPETAGYRPPIWHGRAIEILQKLSPEQLAAARRFAESRGHDLDDIRRRLEERDTSHGFRTLYEDVIRDATNGIGASLTHDVSLKELFDTLYEELCGPEGTFTGIAVIFDEFHQFVARMARHRESESLGALIEQLMLPSRVRSGSAFFIALGTMDPTDVVRQQLGTIDENNPVAKEINRIPGQGLSRFILRSELESVLDGLLRQDPHAWAELADQTKVRLREATELAYHAFQKHFDARFSGRAPELRKRVTEGAFPLHPITTQLLTNLEFQVVQEPRGVLDFVKERYERYADHDAILDGSPNWIFPNEVFETFAPMLPQRVQDQFQVAVDTLGGDMTPEQEWVLQAVALIEAAKLATPASGMGGFPRIVAEMANMDVAVVGETLADLEERGILERDRVTGAYRLPQGASRAQFKKLVRDKRDKLGPGDITFDTLNRHIADADNGIADHRPTHVPWGHPKDWAFHRVFATRLCLSEAIDRARSELRPSLDGSGTKGWKRGIEIVFVADSSDDSDWIRSEGPNLIRDAFPTLEKPPVFISASEQPDTQIECALLDLIAADRISREVQRELGQQYGVGRDQLLKKLREACRDLGKKLSLRIVAPSLRTVAELHKKEATEKFQTALLQRAYPCAPTTFVTDSDLASTKHLARTANVTRLLMMNSVREWYGTAGNGPEKVLVEHHLRDQWGMLDPEMALSTPSDPKVRAMWEFLNDNFPEGETRPLAGSLQKLVRPPCGLDTCTLMLVVGGWLGFQSAATTLFVDRQKFDPASLDSKWQTVLQKMLTMTVRRENVDERNRRLNALIADIEGDRCFSQGEALAAIAELREFEEASLPSDLQGRVKKAKEKISKAKEQATNYAQTLLAVHQPTFDVAKSLDAIDSLRSFQLGIVREPNWPSPQETLKRVTEGFEEFWKEKGHAYANIDDQGKYSERKKSLSSIAKRLQNAGFPKLGDLVKQTIDNLESQKRHLAAAEQQQAFRQILSAFDPKRYKLCELRSNKLSFQTESEKLQPLRPEVASEFEAKIAGIDCEIEAITNCEDLADRLESAKSLRSLWEAEQAIKRRQERLDGSDEAKETAKLLNRARSLQKQFEALDKLVASMPASRTELESRIAGANEAAMSPASSSGLREFAKTNVGRLQVELENRVRLADQTFSDFEDLTQREQATVEQLEEAYRNFESPSEYLSEELRKRIPNLKARIQKELDRRNAERIKSLALKLSGDRELLRELAQYLQRLASE